MEHIREYAANAEIAFSNKQYEAALNWYRKVLDLTPDDLYALSRAGAICVPLGKFEESKGYFGRALELDPANGDNAFNYANACFFNKDNVKAFELYVEAEKLGCSDDVKPRLYYQMALLCSMRQDVDSALVYIRKCEESDPTGMIALKPDLISEKLKLHMIRKSYAEAEKCAAQLVAINPTDFRSYMVYFSILLAHKNHEAAERLLEDAERYAALSDENRFALLMQAVTLRSAMGDLGKAIALLEARRAAGGLTNDQLSQLLLALAEAYSKNGDQDGAIRLLHGMLSGQAFAPAETEETQTVPEELAPEELDEMLRQELEVVEEKVAFGEIDSNLGLYALTDYDEEGQLVHYYDELAYLFAEQAKEEAAEQPPEPGYMLSGELREKTVFTLLSCHLEKDEFLAAQKLANALKYSKNPYYNYFGIYTEAMAERKLAGNTPAAERKYAEALAFFRKQSFADATDALACIFRARLYAEQGKYEKAEQIANLLSEADRKTIAEYIERCKA